MIQFFIPLVSSFLTKDILGTLLYPLFCIYFVAAVPSLVRASVRWR